jgi:hypothetical protein
MDEKINFIRHYQNSIEKSKDNLERVSIIKFCGRECSQLS